MLLTGLKGQCALPSPPAVLSNLIAQEKLIQLLDAAGSNKQHVRKPYEVAV